MFHKPSRTLLACVAIFLAFFFLAGSVTVPAPKPVVGADGSVAPAAEIGWGTILAALGGASGTVGVALAFLKEHQSEIVSVAQSVGLPIPDVTPGALADNVKAAAELAEAVASYARGAKDKNTQRRMVLAFLSEAGAIEELQSPAIEAALSALSQAAVAKWYPAPDVPGK